MGNEVTLTDARKAVLALKKLHPLSSESEPFRTIDDFLECSVANKIELENALMIQRNDLAQAVAHDARTVLDLMDLRVKVLRAMRAGHLPADFI